MTLPLDLPLSGYLAYLRREHPAELAWGERSPYIRRYVNVKERGA